MGGRGPQLGGVNKFYKGTNREKKLKKFLTIKTKGLMFNIRICADKF